MNNEYWEAVIDEICDKHGLDISTEKSVAIAKDMRSAADVAEEICRDPCYMVDPLHENN